MPPLQPQRGKLLFDVGALLQLGHKVHFFNDLPGGNVCFAHALFANARHKAIVLVHRSLCLQKSSAHRLVLSVGT